MTFVAKDKTGERYGKLVVVGHAPKRPPCRNSRWLCQCDCGKTADVGSGHLSPKHHILSCGCLEGGRAKGANATHGQSDSRLYHVWEFIKVRCYNPAAKAYPDYGGRGIIMCDAWRDSFEAFAADMGQSPSNEHSIDRKDVNGNYEPNNCRWATKAEQARNKRNNRIVQTPDGPMCVVDAAAKYGLKFGNLMNRIRRGWPEERWLAPIGKKYSSVPVTLAKEKISE